MSIICLLSAALLTVASASHRGGEKCYDVEPIDRTLREQYCDQPMFVNFSPKTEEITLVDNICITYFPLPDDPDTFQIYTSRVYCDGSNDIVSTIGTQFELGVVRSANPFVTATEITFGYAGCDTYLVYRCNNHGGDDNVVNIFGLSAQCRTIGLSCLRKVEEIVRDNCLPEQDYYVLPMKLPNRCVTQQLCLQPPNPFYNHLPGVGGPGVALV